MKKRKKISIVSINFGFAEDAFLSHIDFVNRSGGFDTAKEAHKDLAEKLFEKYQNEVSDYGKTEVDITEDEFSSYLRGLATATADDFGDEPDDWWPWNSVGELLEFDKNEWTVLDSFTLHEARAEDYIAYLIFEDEHKERIKSCTKCGGIGFKCAQLRLDGTHATIKDEHHIWACCAPFWEQPGPEIEKRAIQICENKKNGKGIR